MTRSTGKQNLFRIYVTVIDANDNIPVIKVPRDKIYISNESNSTIFQATVTDIDSGPNGDTEFLPFLTSDPMELSDSFSIQSNGTVTISRLTNSSLSGYLTLTATDGGIPPNYAYYTVQVLDEKPENLLSGWSDKYFSNKCVEPLRWNVNENEGSIMIGKLPTATNGAGNLQIVKVNPEIAFDSLRLKKSELYTARSFNYEKLSALNVVVADRDQNCYFLIHVTIRNINDCPPKFVKNYNLEIPEEQGANYYITTLAAVDEDTKSLLFAMVTEGVPFHVSDDGKLFTNRNFDYETEKMFHFDVSVTDGKFVIKTTIYVTILDVNDNNPKFSADTYTFYAWSDNVEIGQVTVTDDDQKGSQIISYFLLTPTSGLSVDPENGTITNNYYNTKTKAPVSYEVAIVAVDHGFPPRTSMARISIKLDDQENYDQIYVTLNYSIPITMRMATNLFDLTTEFDSAISPADHSFIVNSAKSSTDHGLFQLTKNYIVQFIGHEGLIKFFGKTVVIYIDVISKAFPISTGAIIIYIELGASNYNSPVFRQTKYEFYIGDQSGGTIGQVSAIDSDSGSYGQIRYSIMDDGMNLPFSVNRTSGELRYNRTQSNSNIIHYTFNAIASDIGYEFKQTRVTVDVTIKDAKSNATFAQPVYECFIPSNNQTNCQPILVNKSVQRKAWIKPSDIFRVDLFTGQITLKRPDVPAKNYITSVCIDHQEPTCATVIVIVKTTGLSGIPSDVSGGTTDVRKINAPFGIVISDQSKYVYRQDDSLRLKPTATNQSDVDIYIFDISKNPTIVKMRFTPPTCQTLCNNVQKISAKKKTDVTEIKCVENSNIISTNQCRAAPTIISKNIKAPVSFFGGAIARIILPTTGSVSTLTIRYKTFDTTLRVLAVLNNPTSAYSYVIFTKGCIIALDSHLQRKELNTCNNYPQENNDVTITVNLRPLSISISPTHTIKMGANVYLTSLWFGGYLFGPLTYREKLYQPFRGVLLSLAMDNAEVDLEIFEQNIYLKSAVVGEMTDACATCTGSCKLFQFGSQCKVCNSSNCMRLSRWNLFSATLGISGLVVGLCTFIIYVYYRNTASKKYKRATSSICLTDDDRADKIYNEQPLPLPMTPFSTTQKRQDQVRNAFYDPDLKQNTDGEYGITVGIYLEPNVSTFQRTSNRIDDCLETNYLAKRVSQGDYSSSMDNIIRTLPTDPTGKEVGIENVAKRAVIQ